jgi:hypothetical protein
MDRIASCPTRSRYLGHIECDMTPSIHVGIVNNVMPLVKESGQRCHMFDDKVLHVIRLLRAEVCRYGTA